jgi:hypothetical protein
MKTLTEKNAALLTGITIGITFILRIFIAAYTGLGIGESYYFRGALKLDLSYFDQPPLFFWLGGLGIKIFGLNALGIRFPSVLLFAGTSWLLFLVTKKLYNSRAGFWAVLLMNLSAVFTIPIAVWFQPDAPLMFFWLLSTYLIIEVLLPKQDLSRGKIYLLWILVGVSMGLATLSKYHVLFLFAGVFMFIATNKEQRRWLTHPGPYIAVLITIVMAAPILWWNYNNHWVSFVFQGSRAGAGGGKLSLHPDWFFRSIGGQAAWVLPWIWIPLIGQLIKSFRQRNQVASYSFIFWLSVLPLVFFTIITLWADLQYHFHWQAPGYMMLFIPLGFAVDQNLNSIDKQKGTRRWLIFTTCFTLITVGVLTLHMVTGFWQVYGPRWVVKHFKVDTDPTIQGVDYDDLNTRFVKEGWLQNKNIFTGSTRWWLSGKVDWVLRGQKPIVVLDEDPRNLAFLVNPTDLLGKDAIIIGQQHQDSIDPNVKPFFDSVTQLKDVDVIRNGRVELKLQVYYCKNFHIPAKPMPTFPIYRQLTGKPPFGN